MSPSRSKPGGLTRYLSLTRSPLHSLLALAPLVLLHALLTWLFRPPVAAAAALWVQAPLLRLGLQPAGAAFVLAGLFAVAAFALSARDLRSRRVRLEPLLIPATWIEGAGWGLVLHVAWNGLGSGRPGASGLGPGDVLALALGAGIYEELVFRVGLYWLVLHALKRLARRDAGEGAGARAPWPVVLAAVLITSTLFALAHHLAGEALSLHALVFRTFAALYLTTLYALRGLGIAACAHAAYNVLVELA